MKAKTKKGIKYTLLSALVALVGTVTIAASNPDFALGRNIQILFNMFRELNLLYVDQIDPDEMLLDAADGMTSKLDPYTELIPEKEMADFEIMTTGKYGGMGAMIRQKDDYVMIAQPYKNSPADKAGLVVGDLLLEVNGESIKGYEVSKVSSMLKGTPGTTLHLKVRKLLTGQEEELTFQAGTDRRVGHSLLERYRRQHRLHRTQRFFRRLQQRYPQRCHVDEKSGDQRTDYRPAGERRRHPAGGGQNPLDVRPQRYRGSVDAGTHEGAGCHLRYPKRTDRHANSGRRADQQLLGLGRRDRSGSFPRTSTAAYCSVSARSARGSYSRPARSATTPT